MSTVGEILLAEGHFIAGNTPPGASYQTGERLFVEKTTTNTFFSQSTALKAEVNSLEKDMSMMSVALAFCVLCALPSMPMDNYSFPTSTLAPHCQLIISILKFLKSDYNFLCLN